MSLKRSTLIKFRRSETDVGPSTSSKKDAHILKFRRASTMCNLSYSSSGRDHYPPGLNDRVVQSAHDKKENLTKSLPNSLADSSDDCKDYCVAPFDLEEIVLGPWLGSGEFSDVYEVHSFCIKPGVDDDIDLDKTKRRAYLRRNAKYRKTGKSRYALKHIKDYYLLDHSESQYVQAASDLVLESELLANLEHPHIIKLRGIAHAGAAGFNLGPKGYFLIIDRLFETLDQRIRSWTAERKKRRGSILRRSFSSIMQTESNSNKKWLDRSLSVALQIAAALKYLHSNSIIYRDLKPTNIGFDVRGDVKIFDFGLARIVPPEGDPNIEKFQMSGAGSPRYMAPEILLNDQYNVKADVYSFSIVLWEMISGKSPYAFARNKDELVDFVANDNGRPVIDANWPDSIKGMLESSFDREMWKRPKMSLFVDIIRDQLSSLRGGNDKGLADSEINLRRSVVSDRRLQLEEELWKD